MKNLQKLIDKRAETRLEEDLKKLYKALQKAYGNINISRLDPKFALEFVTTDRDGKPIQKKESVSNAFFALSSEFFRALRKSYKERYQEKETELFLEELDALKASKEELLERLDETLNYVSQQIDN